MKPDLPIFKAETAYTSLTIEQKGGQLLLRTDGDALQSVINQQNPQILALKNLRSLMGILLFLPPPERICLLGTGGGSLIHFLRFHYPKSHITAVEIDHELLEIMHAKMSLPRADDLLTYVIDDASHFIDTSEQKFDLIIADLFLGIQSPPWLLQSASMHRLNAMLTDTSGLCYNLVIDSEVDFKAFYANLRTVFQQKTLCLPVEGLDNTIAFALRHQPEDLEMAEYMQKAFELSDQHDSNYMEVLSAIYATNPVGSGII